MFMGFVDATLIPRSVSKPFIIQSRVAHPLLHEGYGAHEFSQKMLETIFTPFTRCHKNEGRRLGRAISKRLVESMGGSLRVETRPGFGSCFFFRLPLEPVK